MTATMPGSRRTKIVGTIGPASAGRVGELVAAGLDVARINLSHGDRASHRAAVDAVRTAAVEAGREIAVLIDLAGPKVRLGALPGGVVELEVGEAFELRQGADPTVPAAGSAAVSQAGPAAALEPGDRILLGDGAVELRVEGRAGAAIRTAVVAGGTIRSRAGVSVPAERFSGPAMTERDLADIDFVLELGADYVAQSFVRGVADVEALRDRLGPAGPPIVVKVETRPAVDAIDGILGAADAIIVARGDLGVELPFEDVPIVQRQLVGLARERGVPVVVATQMLESMVGAPRPTRAEVSDVANAVFEGADGILLSAETAIGAYPALAVAAADRICRRAEADAIDGSAGGLGVLGRRPGADALHVGPLARAAVALVRGSAGVAGIACFTRTGRTARELAALRPGCPIYAATGDAAVARRLALVHGVRAVVVEPAREGVADRLGWLAGELRALGVIDGVASVAVLASAGGPGSPPDRLAIDRGGG